MGRLTVSAAVAQLGDTVLLRPPRELDVWLSAGIAVRLDGGSAETPFQFPALLAGSLVVVTQGALSGATGRLPDAFVAGPSTAVATLRATPGLQCLGLMVRPAATAHLLGDTPALLVDGVAAARDVFGAAWAGWEERVRAAPAPHARLDVLFDFVRGLARTRDAAHRAERSALMQHAALAGASSATRLTGYGRRQFERVFAGEFGLPPKRFQRLARAEAALREVMACGRCDADLALRHGYFDQSHLGRDFRELAGGAPRALLAALRSGDAAHWPLLVGAGYARSGLRADFAPASHFS